MAKNLPRQTTDCLLCLIDRAEDSLRRHVPADHIIHVSPDLPAWLDAQRGNAHAFAQECGGSAAQQDHYAWEHAS